MAVVARVPGSGPLNGLAWLALIALGSGSAKADIPPGLVAKMVCKAERTVVMCFVPVQATPQSHITYAEANLLKAPSFLKPVAGQSTFSEAKSQRPNLRLGFVVQGNGTGLVEASVRAVVCADNGTGCPHFSKTVVAQVSVAR